MKILAMSEEQWYEQNRRMKELRDGAYAAGDDETGDIYMARLGGMEEVHKAMIDINIPDGCKLAVVYEDWDDVVIEQEVEL